MFSIQSLAIIVVCHYRSHRQWCQSAIFAIFGVYPVFSPQPPAPPIRQSYVEIHNISTTQSLSTFILHPSSGNPLA
ncbi:MAG: hypothetical protein ACK53Y_08465, partial [bacterium]